MVTLLSFGAAGLLVNRVQSLLKFDHPFLLEQQNGHYHRFKNHRVCRVAAFRSKAPAHIHQLIESFSVIFAQGSCEAIPPTNFLF